jgi:hypothetical protein
MAGRGARFDLLVDRDERDAEPAEFLERPDEVADGTTEPVEAHLRRRIDFGRLRVLD